MSELIMQCLVCGILLVAVWICLPEQVLFWILAVVALFGAICLNDKKRQNKTDKKSILTLEAIR